jgi:hypothetical protein
MAVAEKSVPIRTDGVKVGRFETVQVKYFYRR